MQDKLEKIKIQDDLVKLKDNRYKKNEARLSQIKENFLTPTKKGGLMRVNEP